HTQILCLSILKFWN
ncbi:hypothetical protein CISIN_1g0225292mg, partial [Citrus sinensis]